MDGIGSAPDDAAHRHIVADSETDAIGKDLTIALPILRIDAADVTCRHLLNGEQDLNLGHIRKTVVRGGASQALRRLSAGRPGQRRSDGVHKARGIRPVDDAVAKAQLGHQDLRHMGFEPITVDRPVQHHRRDHAGYAQACNPCGLAVVMQKLIRCRSPFRQRP